MRIKIAVFFVFCFVAGMSCVAAEETAGDYLYGIGTKFVRGLENVVTSLAEIPCTVHADMKDREGSGFFSGFGKGTVFMLRRMLIGVTEVGTFFIPMERTIPRVCQSPQHSIA